MADNSPRQMRRASQTEPSQSVTPQPKLGSANQVGAVVAEARQLDLIPAGQQDAPIVEVVDGATPPQRQETEPVQETTAEQLAPLQAQVEQERQRANEAYRDRNRLEAERRAAQIQTADANLAAIENGIAAAKARADAAEAALADAHAKADAAAIARATRALTAADREIGQFETQKVQWGAYATQVKQAPAPQAAQVETMDVNGRQVDLSSYTPAERKWIRDNPQFMTDVTFNQRAQTAAQMALNMGYSRDSDQYIEYIASQTKPTPQPQQEPPKMEQRKPVTAAAPVSRSATPQASQANNKIMLSRTPVEDTNGLSEVEAAQMAYPELPVHEACVKYGLDREAMIAAGDTRVRRWAGN